MPLKETKETSSNVLTCTNVISTANSLKTSVSISFILVSKHLYNLAHILFLFSLGQSKNDGLEVKIYQLISTTAWAI